MRNVLLFFAMKRLPGIFLILLCGAILVASDYRIKSVKILPIDSYPARISQNGITIAADPYSTDEKSFSAFDVRDLNSRGYFPIHLIVQNDSQTFLIFRTREVSLITASGQQLYTTPATIVVEDVLKSGLSKKFPLIKSHNKSISSKAGSPLSDFTGKEITSKTIDPGAVCDGFVFFYTPTPKRNIFRQGTLLIPTLEVEGAHKSLGPFSIPLNPAFSTSK
jgi:hypothetical protein